MVRRSHQRPLRLAVQAFFERSLVHVKPFTSWQSHDRTSRRTLDSSSMLASHHLGYKHEYERCPIHGFLKSELAFFRLPRIEVL